MRCEVKITKKYKVASFTILSRIEGITDPLMLADARPTRAMITNARKSVKREFVLVFPRGAVMRMTKVFEMVGMGV